MQSGLSALSERESAPVAQWIRELTSDYPGRCAVARAWAGERRASSYLLCLQVSSTDVGLPVAQVPAHYQRLVPAYGPGPGLLMVPLGPVGLAASHPHGLPFDTAG